MTCDARALTVYRLAFHRQTGAASGRAVRFGVVFGTFPDEIRSAPGAPVSKRTFQPNNRRRAKTHGFRLRMRTRAGRAVLAARRRKGRAELSA